MIILLELALGFFLATSAVYAAYFVLVMKTKRTRDYVEKLKAIAESSIGPDKLPNVTILIPAYNEERTIYEKIRNISEFDYPLEKIEILVLDDNSSDRTRELADKALKDFGLKGGTVMNETRTGVNVLYNRAVPQANSEYIMTTDADAMIPPDSLMKAVKVLTSLSDVGGIAAKMLPFHKRTTTTTRMTVAYTASYYSMLVPESAIFSTFPGSTSCMLMRKSAFSPISASYGSSDGNISLSIIKNGFRFVVAPCIVYYEPISERLPEQRRQKIRRATRLIQSTFLNLDFFLSKKYREFGKTIFPLRFLMTTLCPVLVLSSIFFFFLFMLFTSPILFGALLVSSALVLMAATRVDVRLANVVASFVFHQVYLSLGFLLSFRKRNVWKKIQRPTE